MKPKRIILIRHGESEGNVDKNVYSKKPDYALLLTEKGTQQALRAGERLKEIVKTESVLSYVSPLFRTRMTFECLAHGLSTDQREYVEEPRLREQEWGHLRGIEECDRVNQERDEYGTFYFRIPDGESGADVYDRVSDFFGTLHRDFEKEDFPDNVIVVTHGMSIRLFLMRWFHWTVEKFEKIGNPDNCQMVIMERNVSGKYELKTKLREHGVIHGFQRPINLNFEKSN